MTATAPAPAQLWSTMPGWGIAADLTPPELINSRELKTLRKWIGAGLVILLLACSGEYLAAARQHSAASAALDDVNAQTFHLQAGVRKYAGLTQIQGSVTEIQAEIAKLMGSDVDFIKLMGRLRSTLPSQMTISSEAVTITAASPNTAQSGTASAAGTTIGTVTISGTGRALANLATYLERLQAIPGVTDVNPTSNVRSGRSTQYSLSLNMSTAAFSHRFDVSRKGTK